MAIVENFTGAKMFQVDLIFDTHLFDPALLTPEYVLRIFRERGLLSKGVRVSIREAGRATAGSGPSFIPRKAEEALERDTKSGMILTPTHKNRFVRKIPALDMGVPFEKKEPRFSNWCDRCRVFTDNPEAHDHDKRPLD